MKATDTPVKPAARHPVNVEIIVDGHEHNGEVVAKGTVIEGLDASIADQLVADKTARISLGGKS